MGALHACLFDVAPMPMILCSFPEGAVRQANRRAVELFIVGRKVTACRIEDILGDENSRLFQERLRDSGGFVDDFETVLQTPYGQSFPGMLSGQMLIVEDERCILIGLNDITERKAAEETLRRFFDGGPLAMLLFRLSDNRVIRINRRASELFAVSNGQGDHSLDDYLGDAASQEFLTLLAGGGFVESFEVRLATDYGLTFWALISGQILEVGGERCVLVGVTDNTDRKQAEEDLNIAKDMAEQATQSKSLFLATMSHEIRTPMNGVLGMLEILGRSRLDDEQREMVDVIEQSASSLLTIIDDILDLSKIEAGKLAIEYIPIGLRHVVEITANLAAPRAREKGLELAWWVDPELPEQVLGDPVRLRQIMLNFLTNAVKFTEKGSVTVRVSLVEHQVDGVLVRFAVKDTGIGLTPEQAGRLFQAFSQAETSTTRRFGGTGLGLSICRSLTELMRGRIGVDSEAGQGSCFWFELPLESLAEQPAPPAQDMTGITILIVDDLVEARETMAATLRARGAAVIEAINLDQALTVGGPPADLALIDLPEPITDLLHPLTRRIGHQRVLPTLPSGHGEAGVFCDEQGFLAPLSKPVRGGVLARAIGSALNRPVAEPREAALGERTLRPSLTIEEASAAGRLILVAEDHAVNRLVIAKQLTELGHRFEIAHDGEAAWQMLRSKPYGLLLSDCSMPVLDGYDLTRRIRAAEAANGLPRLPVIALTANVLVAEADKCRASGFDDFLSKPVVLAQLAACIDQWLPSGEKKPALAREPAPVAPSGLIDLNQFAKIVGSEDRAVIGEVLGYFVDTFDTTFGTVRQALKNRDRAALGIAAHTAKGAARSACAPVLADILEELEERALSREPYAKLAARIDAADQAFTALRQAIERGVY